MIALSNSPKEVVDTHGHLIVHRTIMIFIDGASADDSVLQGQLGRKGSEDPNIWAGGLSLLPKRCTASLDYNGKVQNRIGVPIRAHRNDRGYPTTPDLKPSKL